MTTGTTNGFAARTLAMHAGLALPLMIAVSVQCVAANPRPSTARSAHASTPMFSTEAAAQRHCPGDHVVWLDAGLHAYAQSNAFYAPGSRWYAHTQFGGFTCRREARAAGYRDGSTPMAAIIGRDRVVATLPDFKQIPGSSTELDALGPLTSWVDGAGSTPDGIVIRRVVVPNSERAGSFSVSSAIRIARRSNAAIVEGIQMTPLSFTVLVARRSTICGRAGIVVLTEQWVRWFVDPPFGSTPPTPAPRYLQVVAYGFALVGDEVWESQYERGYGTQGVRLSPREESSLLGIAKRFCVQQNYLRSSR